MLDLKRRLKTNAASSLSPGFPSQPFLSKHHSVNNLTIDSESSLAPVRLCPSCVVNLARYLPCERSHLKIIQACGAESKGASR